MIQKMLIVFLCFGNLCVSSASSNTIFDDKVYKKEYFDIGHIKSEGWEIEKLKTNFWIFYHRNGTIATKGHFRNNKEHGYWYFYDNDQNLIKEGHFVQGIAENWWIFHEIAVSKKTKIQFRNNSKNGFALYYKRNKLIKAEKYKNNYKTGEWTSVSSFRRDIPDLAF